MGYRNQLVAIDTISYRFPPSSKLCSVQTNSSSKIAPRVHVAVDKNRGQITTVGKKVFRMSLMPKETALEWSELAIALPEENWLKCHSVRVKLCANADETVRVHFALRMFYKDGFCDCFADSKVELSPENQFHEAVVWSNPDVIKGATHCAIHMFPDAKRYSIEINDLEIAGSW